MRTPIPLALLTLATLFSRADAQTYDTNNVVVQTFVGSGFSGYVDGQGTQTMFSNPLAIAADTSSNLFVMDYYNFRIRKITPDGTVSTFAGGGPGSLPGYGTNVSLPSAVTMTIDHSNTLYLVEYPSGTALLRIGSDGYVSRILLPGLTGGQAHEGICVDSGNNVYISDFHGNKIYRYRTNGVLEVFAGSGNSGSIDGNGIFTSFTSPSSLAADSANNIYVWDSGNQLIRRINQNRDVTTIAGNRGGTGSADGVGTNATFYGISAMCSDGVGNIYLAAWSSTGGSSIRRLSPTTNVTTVAGSFTNNGYANGSGSIARFDFGNEGICISQGMIFVADAGNQRIRQITFNPTAPPVSPANLGLRIYPGLQITGTVGRNYRIESSTDLSNWTTETTLFLTRTPYPWIDEQAAAQKKFYRAFLLP